MWYQIKMLNTLIIHYEVKLSSWKVAYVPQPSHDDHGTSVPLPNHVHVLESLSGLTVKGLDH